FFTKALTSSCVTRPLNPVPDTRVRSTPSSRANFRTEGPACAREKPGSLMGGNCGAPGSVACGSLRGPGAGSAPTPESLVGAAGPVPSDPLPARPDCPIAGLPAADPPRAAD